MKEYLTIDKTGWGDGQWQAEPDKVQWTDKETGMPCLAVRNGTSGHWCGYVGVEAWHPLFKVHYDEAYDRLDCNVHGGLTFSESCEHGPEDRAICHVPEPGQSDDVWWFGFDCNHSDDLAPAMVVFESSIYQMWEGTYRDLDYVKGECATLARALKEAR